MRNNILLKNIESAASKGNVAVRRYTLSDMISESYNICYDSAQGSNLKKLAEAHLEDVKENPTDIERLSRQMCNLKYLASMVESRKMRDSELIKKATPRKRVLESKVAPKRAPRRKLKDCNESFDDDKMTPAEMREYWDENHEDDPILARYKSYDDWYKESKKNGYVRDEDIDESEDITEEELDELANHLSEIRKKKGMKESRSPRRRMKGSMNEAKSSYVVQYGVDILTDDDQADIDSKIESALNKVGIKVLGIQPTDTSWSVEEYEKATGIKVKDVLGESKKFSRRRIKESKNLKTVRLSRRVNEGKTFKNAGHDWEILDTKGDYTLVHSTTKKVTPYVVAYKLDKSDGSWGQGHYFDTEKDASNYLKKVREAKSWSSIKEGMKNFSKASSSKAFYKTFKKMYESLKEGKALTRQESINLYKAANSAMTHFSVELEHNPKFLNAFNECTSLLSKDVDSLLESLKQGMAPSKYTMKSLAKFAEALLYESDEDLRYVDNVNGYKVYRKIENGKGVWFAKRQDDPDDKMFPITYEQARGYEEIAGSENIRKLRKDLGKKLLPEAFYDDFDGDDESAKREYDARKRAYEKCKHEYDTRGDGNDNSIFSRKEKKDLAAAHANALARQKNYPLVDVDESAEEEEELDDIETSIEDEEADSIDNEEDFVGDDEGDIQSEEEERFCQEYADAREELHNDMEEKYEDTEDPGVQEKLAQDAEEVAILKGEDPEEEGEEGEEEAPEDSEEESEEDEESEEEDDSDITDDELAELKKHLTEMRKAKKSCK